VSNLASMKTYKLVAVPFLLPEGEFKGHLETVTFVAASEAESHKWWAVRSVSTSLRQVASEFSVEDLLSPLSGLAD
jgi:hypothetical protein